MCLILQFRILVLLPSDTVIRTRVIGVAKVQTGFLFLIGELSGSMQVKVSVQN
jgi:hypothetical protein